MKAIKYYAEAAMGAWAKTGYLFDNGFFICEFKYYNKPFYICRKYDFENAPETIMWGKNVVDHNSMSDSNGAFADYQTFNKLTVLDVDFDQLKYSIINRSVNFWNEEHYDSEKLKV